MDSTSADQSPCPRSVGIVGAGRLGRALARALADAGVAGRTAPPAAGELPAAEAIVLCVPDAEIARGRGGRGRAAPLVGHTSGATPLAALEPARERRSRGLRAPPAPDLRRRRGRRDFAGVGCAVAGSTPGALAAAPRAGRAARHAPVRARRRATGPPTTPPPRSPPTSWSRSRPRPSRWPRAPGSSRARPARCWRRSSAPPSRTGPRSGPSGALTGPGRPRRRGHRRAPARRGGRRGAGAAAAVRRAGGAHARAGAGRRCRHEDRAHRRRPARGARARAARGPQHRPGARRWATSTRATCR